ncbi:hypothetical protein [Azospirillum canadense]|uniref:hypothetical protein n=1 Tax=Azospirillum canadense TaxID=403962 RepID=UPI00222757C6|nr:hypothetical protein [Azospirillum canadense]MCW2240395.1 hypothetical protein [Azospirillum canadense]
MPAPNITAFPSPRSPLPFDPAMPAADRHALLIGALPPPLRNLLADGHVERRPRFSDDGFDGMTETWFPPAGVTGQLAAMAQRALDDLVMTALAPAPTDYVLARVFALLSHFPAKGMTPDAERLVALDWAEDLGEYPAWAIDAAARAWRRTKKWRPSIAEMRALCNDFCAGERRLAERLQAVVQAGRQDRARAGEVTALSAGAIRRMW